MNKVQPLDVDDEPSPAAELRIELEPINGRASFLARLPHRSASDLVTLTALLAVVAAPGVTFWLCNLAGVASWLPLPIAFTQVFVVSAIMRKSTQPTNSAATP